MAQFTAPEFTGNRCVKQVPFKVSDNGKAPASPSMKDFLQYYNLLENDYDSLLVLTSSAALSNANKHAREAHARCERREQIQVIDSQAVGIGLGLLVQLAADAAKKGANLIETERLVRAAISRIYSLFLFHNMSGLVAAGYLSQSQAIIADMLGMAPFYALDDGQLTPIGKVRTPRHTLETFVEFIQEFHDPQYIALVKSTGPSGFRTRLLKQAITETFPYTPFAEHAMNPHMAAMFGSHCISLTVMEKIS